MQSQFGRLEYHRLQSVVPDADGMQAFMDVVQTDFGPFSNHLQNIEAVQRPKDVWLKSRFQLLGAKVIRPKITETTAMGAAYLAGLATGFWNDISEIEKQWKVEREFAPDKKINTSLLAKEWQRAVRTARAWSADASNQNN